MFRYTPPANTSYKGIYESGDRTMLVCRALCGVTGHSSLTNCDQRKDCKLAYDSYYADGSQNNPRIRIFSTGSDNKVYVNFVIVFSTIK